jgi:hypothetical protein
MQFRDNFSKTAYIISPIGATVLFQVFLLLSILIFIFFITIRDLKGNPLTEIGAKAFVATWYPHGM